jgi:hypothetical protein
MTAADIEVRIIKEITLYPHKFDSGCVQLGWQTNVTGMRAGPSPLMCRILVPGQSGDYPEGWFPVQSVKSQTLIIKELDDGFIPDWLARDCFEYAWRILKMKEEREVGA